MMKQEFWALWALGPIFNECQEMANILKDRIMLTQTNSP